MGQIENYLSRVYEKQGQKKLALDSMFRRFGQLMGLTDVELRIQNANERVLSEDPIYNSSEGLKDAIGKRKLSGDSYKQAHEHLNQVPTPSKSLVKAGTDLDVIPRHIDALVAATAGHKEQYLVEFCKEHQLTTRDLLDLVAMKGYYSTDFDTLGNALRRGYSIPEIDGLLEARENLNHRGDTVSIEALMRFHQTFFGGEVDSAMIAENLRDVHGEFGRAFYGSTMNILVKTAKQTSRSNLEAVVDDIMSSGILSGSADIGYRKLSDDYSEESFP